MIEIFKIGFLNVTLIDIIDILLVTVVFYQLYIIIRGTIASQIFFGLIVVLLLYFLAQIADFKALGWILKLVTDIWVIAFIILFQPEIRRFLLLLGRNPLLGIFIKPDEKNQVDIIADTAFELAQHQHGALMILIKTSGIKGVVETGEALNAQLSKSLLRSIFFPRSPLHDGAVVIKNDIVEAARCTLPLTQKTSIDGLSLGMRHRAGVGISEQADVLAIIVSEETGGISVAQDGNLTRGLSREGLKKKLQESLASSKIKGWRYIFEQFSKS